MSFVLVKGKSFFVVNDSIKCYFEHKLIAGRLHRNNELFSFSFKIVMIGFSVRPLLIGKVCEFRYLVN